MSARPLAVTWLVGTGVRPPGKLSVDALVVVLAFLSSELPPPLMATPTPTPTTMSRTPRATIHPWRASHGRSCGPVGAGGGGGPGGPAGAAAATGTGPGGATGGGAAGSVGAEIWVGVPMPVATPAPAPSAAVQASMKSRQPP